MAHYSLPSISVAKGNSCVFKSPFSTSRMMKWWNNTGQRVTAAGHAELWNWRGYSTSYVLEESDDVLRRVSWVPPDSPRHPGHRVCTVYVERAGYFLDKLILFDCDLWSFCISNIKCGNIAFLTYKLNWNSNPAINESINLSQGETRHLNPTR